MAESSIKSVLNHKTLTLWVTIIAAVLFIFVGVSCAANPNEAENQIGIVSEEIEVPDIVLDQAKDYVSQWYEKDQSSFPDYNYSNWRIKSLRQVYTYDDFEGMKLHVYRMNFEFLSETPQNIVLAGGMTVTEDGWVMPGYPDCYFLIFKQDGETLTYLTGMMENDCGPGDDMFANDLRQNLIYMLKAPEIVTAFVHDKVPDLVDKLSYTYCFQNEDGSRNYGFTETLYGVTINSITVRTDSGGMITSFVIYPERYDENGLLIGDPIWDLRDRTTYNVPKTYDELFYMAFHSDGAASEEPASRLSIAFATDTENLLSAAAKLSDEEIGTIAGLTLYGAKSLAELLKYVNTIVTDESISDSDKLLPRAMLEEYKENY